MRGGSGSPGLTGRRRCGCTGRRRRGRRRQGARHALARGPAARSWRRREDTAVAAASRPLGSAGRGARVHGSGRRRRADGDRRRAPVPVARTPFRLESAWSRPPAPPGRPPRGPAHPPLRPAACRAEVSPSRRRSAHGPRTAGLLPHGSPGCPREPVARLAGSVRQAPEVRGSLKRGPAATPTGGRRPRSDRGLQRGQHRAAEPSGVVWAEGRVAQSVGPHASNARRRLGGHAAPRRSVGCRRARRPWQWMGLAWSCLTDERGAAPCRRRADGRPGCWRCRGAPPVPRRTWWGPAGGASEVGRRPVRGRTRRARTVLRIHRSAGVHRQCSAASTRAPSTRPAAGVRGRSPRQRHSARRRRIP